MKRGGVIPHLTLEEGPHLGSEGVYRGRGYYLPVISDRINYFLSKLHTYDIYKKINIFLI